MSWKAWKSWGAFLLRAGRRERGLLSWRLVGFSRGLWDGFFILPSALVTFLACQCVSFRCWWEKDMELWKPPGGCQKHSSGFGCWSMCCSETVPGLCRSSSSADLPARAHRTHNSAATGWMLTPPLGCLTTSSEASLGIQSWCPKTTGDCPPSASSNGPHFPPLTSHKTLEADASLTARLGDSAKPPRNKKNRQVTIILPARGINRLLADCCMTPTPKQAQERASFESSTRHQQPTDQGSRARTGVGKIGST